MRSIRTDVLLPILSLLLLTAFTTYGQGVQTMRPNVAINANCNGYVEYLPEGYATSGQTYPLLVFLEGIGETGDGSLTDLQKLLNNGPPMYINNGSFPSSFTVNGQTHRFIIITPQFKTPFWMRDPTPDEINDVITYAVQHYRVNTSRIYLTGISSGAGPVWEYAGYNSTYANRLAAIVPFCGTSTPTHTNARNIANANLPVWAFHNRYDEGVPVSLTLDYISMINQPPAPNPMAKATIYDKSGHDCWYWELYGSVKENNMNVYEWMLQYTRGGTTPPNQSPTANAGTAQTITLPANSVTLNGSGSDPDGTIASYSWSKMAGGAANIDSPGSASTTINGLVQGSYTFRLTFTDNQGATGTSDVNVTVNAAANQAPTANAGADQAITLPNNSVSLSGTGSDPDGFITSYSWSKIGGPGSGTITSPSSPSTTVTGLTQGVYTFRLTVSDNNGASAIDDIVITVNAAANQPPAANAGADQTITLPTNSVTLSGSASDPDGFINAYSWTKIGGPGSGTINSPSSASTTVTGLTQGVYTFRLTVSDNNGASASDDVVITVNAASNQTPSANAGTDQSITLPNNTVTLSGSGSDPDGFIASYSWSKIAGGTANINSPSSASTTITGLVQGSYTFRLTVSDNNGAQATDDVVINVPAAANQSPVVNAGGDQTITLPTSSVTLNGTGSDGDGFISSYAWSKISGPAGETISNPFGASTTVTGLVQGSYTFRLTVTDNGGATGTSDVNVTVNPSSTTGSSKIEAESFTAMSGIQTEFTQDAGGGLNVGWIEQGDWMDYSVTVPSSGTYTINLRVATPNPGAQLQIKRSDGLVLSTANLPNTWGWQSWQTISTTITLSAGTQTIRVQSSSSQGYNINWLEIVGGSGAITLRSAAPQLSELPIASSLSLYPNPVRDVVSLSMDNSGEGRVQVELISLSGAVVKQFSFNKQRGVAQKSLSLIGLAKGTYLMKVSLPGWTKSTQLIKQ